MKFSASVLHHIIAIFILIIVCGCGDSATYTDKDVYRENHLLYDKETRQPLTGHVIKKGKSGKIRSKWEYKNGLVDGNTENYFESGKLQAEGNFKNGKKEGKQTFYHPNGKIYELSHYKNGKLEGQVIITLPSGKPQERAQYTNGKQESVTTYTYYKNGTLKRESYFEKDKLKSKKNYHENGKIKK